MTLALYRRNVFLLSTSQALFLVYGVTMVTFAGLVGRFLADDPAFATLPVALYVIGAMLTTVPASFVMRRIGRRSGLMAGAVIGVMGAALAVYAISADSFWLFCASSMLAGVYQAHSQYYRFTAIEAAPVEFASRAISLVMVGGVVAALVGPWIAVSSRDLLMPIPFAGAFVAAGAVSVLAVAVLSMLRLPPRVETEVNEPARPLGEIVVQPVFMAAALAAAMAYGLMVLIMTATPLAMADCGLSVEATGGVIQGHVLAMFVPSFFTGHLIARFGVFKILYAGMALFAISAVIALSGQGFWEFMLSLVGVGVGWNFLFVGGTTLLTEAHRPSETAKVQGLNELIVSIAAATASFSSGALLNASGWNFVNYGMIPFLALTFMATLWYARHQKLERALARDDAA